MYSLALEEMKSNEEDLIETRPGSPTIPNAILSDVIVPGTFTKPDFAQWTFVHPENIPSKPRKKREAPKDMIPPKVAEILTKLPRKSQYTGPTIPVDSIMSLLLSLPIAVPTNVTMVPNPMVLPSAFLTTNQKALGKGHSWAGLKRKIDEPAQSHKRSKN
jgi:hypothetical protein